MPRFQARAKAFIVTFPQVSEDVQQRFDHEGASLLLNITQDLKDPACFRLGRERHQDGGVHYHMYIGFDEVVHINRPNLFDYFGAHGNIKSVRRTPRTVYDYCGKDGDVRYERGDPPESVSRSRGENGEKWHTICDAPDKDTFLSLCRQLAPKDWLLSNSRILEYANTYYPEVPSPYEGPPSLQRWNATLNSSDGWNRRGSETIDPRGKSAGAAADVASSHDQILSAIGASPPYPLF